MMGTPPREFVELLAMVRGYQRSRAITVAAELGIADLLREGTRSVEDLSRATDTDEASLYRLLRALASLGVFYEHESRSFGLTEMGEYLRSDHPMSVRPVALSFGANYQWKVWGELGHSVGTGESAAFKTLGTDVWRYRRQDADDSRNFDEAMRTFTAGDAAALVAAHDFGACETIADIGGGTGAALASILNACPRARGILFDQPHVVANSPAVLHDAGVGDRVEIVGGSFFESVPPGADTYMLKRILHDWQDREASAILRSVRTAMTTDAELLIVDAVVGPPNEDPLVKFLDLMMLVAEGGRERSDSEWATLLAGAGFRFQAAVRATPNSHVIQAVPA